MLPPPATETGSSQAKALSCSLNLIFDCVFVPFVVKCFTRTTARMSLAQNNFEHGPAQTIFEWYLTVRMAYKKYF